MLLDARSTLALAPARKPRRVRIANARGGKNLGSVISQTTRRSMGRWVRTQSGLAAQGMASALPPSGGERPTPSAESSGPEPAPPPSLRRLVPRLLALLLAAAWLFQAVPLAQGAQGTGPLDAEEPAGPPGKGLTRSIAMRLGVFDQSDGLDGNPFLDESLTVVEPVIVFDWDVNRDWGYRIKAAYDYVSSASIDRLSQYPEQSGASGDFWYGLEFGTRHRINDEWRWSWRAGASFEYDYRSLKLGGDLTWTPTDGRDASVTTSLDVFFDDIDVIRFNGVEEGGDNRLSAAATVQWYQVMGPRLHGILGTTLALQSGFLETPYNGVVVEDGAVPPFPFDNGALGTEITEELPDTRARLALFGRLRQQLRAGTAVELGARLYGDDWGVASVALEPRLYQTLVEDRLQLRLRYRYYTQTAADDFVESLPGGAPLPEFRTSDSDLGEYDAHSVGLQLLWFRAGHWSFDVGADQVYRADGLDSLLFSMGYKIYL